MHNIAGLNLGLLLSHPRDTTCKWLFMCGQVCLMCSSNGDTVTCWDEMLWAGSSCWVFSRHWVGEHTHWYVGGNLCFVEVAIFCPAGTQWCWWHAASLGPPFMRADTSYRVRWHYPLTSVATMGLCALFFVCSTMVYSWAVMKRRSCRTLFTVFSVSAGSLHSYKTWRILKLCQTTWIKS